MLHACIVRAAKNVLVHTHTHTRMHVCIQHWAVAAALAAAVASNYEYQMKQIVKIADSFLSVC